MHGGMVLNYGERVGRGEREDGQRINGEARFLRNPTLVSPYSSSFAGADGQTHTLVRAL